MPRRVKVSFPKEPFDTPKGELVAGSPDTVRVELSEPPTSPITFTVHSRGFTTPDVHFSVPAGQPSLVHSMPVEFVRNSKEYKLRLKQAVNCDLGNAFYKIDPTFELLIAVAFAQQPLSKRLDCLVFNDTVKVRLELSGECDKPVEVTVECDGFTVKKHKVTIPARQREFEFDVTLLGVKGEYECKISGAKNAKVKGYFNQSKIEHLKGKTEFGFKLGTAFAFSPEPMNVPMDALKPGQSVELKFDVTGTVANNASFQVESEGLMGSPITVNPPSAPQRTCTKGGVRLKNKAGTYKAKLINPVNCQAESEIEFTIPFYAGFPKSPMGSATEFYPGDRATIAVELSTYPGENVKLLAESEGFRESVQITFAKDTLQMRQRANVNLVNKTGIYGVRLTAVSGAEVRPDASTTSFKIAPRLSVGDPRWGFVTKPVQPEKPKYDVGEEIGFLIQTSEMHDRKGELVLRSTAFAADIPVKFEPGQQDIRVDARIVETLFVQGETTDKKVDVTLVEITNCTTRVNKTSFLVQPPALVEFDPVPVKPDVPEGHYPGDTVRVRLKTDRAVGPSGARVPIRSDAFAHPQLCVDGIAFVFIGPNKSVGYADVILHCKGGGLEDGGDTQIEITTDTKGCFKSTTGTATVPLKIRPLPLVGFAVLGWIDPYKTTPYYQGELITLKVVLSDAAPSSGAKILLTSTALADPGECEVEFLHGEKERKCKVRIQNAPNPSGPGHVDFFLKDLTTGAVGCKLSPTPEDIKCGFDVLPGPKVQFKTLWISPRQPDYDRGQRATVYAELDAPSPVDCVVRVDSDAFGGAAYFIHFPAGSTVSGAKTSKQKTKDIPGVVLKKGQELLNSNSPVARVVVAAVGMGMGGGTNLLKSQDLPGPIEGAQVVLRGDKKLTVPPTARWEVYDVTLTPVAGCVAGVNITQTLKIRRTPTPSTGTTVLPCMTPPPVPVPPLKYCNLQRILVSEIRGKVKPFTPKRGHNGNGTFEVVAGEGSQKKFQDAFIGTGKIEVMAGKVIYELDEDVHNCKIAIRVDVSDDRCELEFPHVEGEDREHPHLIVLQEFVDRLENVIAVGGSPYKAKKGIDQMEKGQKASRDYPGWVVYLAKNAKKLQKDVRGKAEQGTTLWAFAAKKRPQKYEKLISSVVPLKELDTTVGILGVKELIKAVQHFVAPRLEHYRIIVESCGIPDPGKKQFPAQKLQLDIDVFPSEEFCLFLNFSPIPAQQFGNNGRYYADPALSPNNSTAPDDPNRPANNTNLQESFSLPSQITPGQTSPLENQQATETTTPNQTTVKPLGSHGGGVVWDVPSSALSEEETREQVMSRKQGGSLIFQSDLEFMKSGTPYERTAPSSSKEQRVLPDKPSTRVFHPVYAEGSHSPPSELPDEALREWEMLKCGLVCNGYPRTEFMKAGQAVFAVLYAVRHIGDFFSAMADMVPSWGWGVSIDLGFLEGAFRLRWGWKEYEDWRVFRWAHAQFELQLFRLAIEIWAGFKARALFVRFEFVAFGRIQGALPLSLSVERAGPDGGALFTGSFGAATKAEIGIRIILIHENACYARASIRTGFLFNFKLPEPTEDQMCIIWEAYFLGLSIGIDFKVVGVKKVFQKEKVLIEGNPPGVPFRQGVLFPRGDEYSSWKARRQLRHVWVRTSAKFAQLDEALQWWYDLQFLLLNKRDADEYEKDAETNPAYEWPWTDDPDVRASAFGTGHAIKTTEDSLWKGQWAVFKRALDARQVSAEGDKTGKGKVVKYAKYKSRIPKIGDKLAGDINLVDALAKAIGRVEVTIEKVKQALMLIDHKYISVLRAIDKEICEADEYERPIGEDFQKQLDKAQKWGDFNGDVTKLVDEALEDSKLARLEYYIQNVDAWAIGQVTKP